MSQDGYPRPDKECLHCGQNGDIKLDCQARMNGTPSVRRPTTSALPTETFEPVSAATNQAGPAGTTSKIEITVSINHGSAPEVTGTSLGSVEAGEPKELGPRRNGQSLSEKIGPKGNKKSLLERMDKRRNGRGVRGEHKV